MLFRSDRLLEGPTKLRYGSADEVLKDLDLALGQRSNVQSEETNQLQREQIEHPPMIDLLTSWHQIGEARSNELDASFERLERLRRLGRGADRIDRKNVDRIVKIISLLIGGTVMLPIFLAWVQSSTVVQTPDVVQPSTVVQAPAVVQPSTDIQAIPLSSKDKSSIPISKIIEPAYLRPVKPFKTFKNIQPFQAMALKDGGKTIVTGSIENSELKLNFINASSGEDRAGYTSSTIQLNDSLLSKGSVNTFALPKIYINKKSMFVYFQHTYDNSVGNDLVQINIKDNSQSSPFPYLKNNIGKYHNIHPVSNGELFNEYGNSTPSGTETSAIWEITDNGLKKQKPLNDLSPSILSSDRKSIFQWIRSLSQYEVLILSLDGKTEQRISMPLNMTVPNIHTADGLFSVQRGGTEYLVIQGVNHFPDQIQDSSKISATLPSFYQSKALEAAGGGLTYKGAIDVWDMTQKKFKYSIPCQGEIGQVAIASDGRTLAIAEYGDGRLDPSKNSSNRITVWDLPTGQLLREVNTFASLAFTSDSKTLITGSQEAISLWNVEELRNP